MTGKVRFNQKEYNAKWEKDNRAKRTEYFRKRRARIKSSTGYTTSERMREANKGNYILDIPVRKHA